MPSPGSPAYGLEAKILDEAFGLFALESGLGRVTGKVTLSELSAYTSHLCHRFDVLAHPLSMTKEETFLECVFQSEKKRMWP